MPSKLSAATLVALLVPSMTCSEAPAHLWHWPQPACPGASAAVKVHRTGSDAGHLYTANYSACAAACCGRPGCVAWSWDSNETQQQAPADCQASGAPFSCCWLRGTAGKLMPGLGCYGTPECDSWSGVVERPAPSCAKPSPPVAGELTGCNGAQVYAANASACQAACCGDASCVSWNWDRNLSTSLAPPVCKAQGVPFSCCWKKTCAGTAAAGGGLPGSSHGTSGRSPAPAPAPPPPQTCPPGTEYMAGFSCLKPTESGSPRDAGLPASYDCAVRQHMWEFAQVTLPARGSFQTAYVV